MKNTKKLVIIILSAIVLFSVAKDMLIQSILSGAISKAIHVPVSIGATHVSFVPSTVTIKSFKLKNPIGFKDASMLDMPLIHIDFDASSIGKKVLHFKDVKIAIKELVVVKNKDGKLNIDALKQGVSKEKKSATSSKSLAFQIDKLDLTIEKVIYRDYSSGADKPQETVFDIDIKNRVYTNLTSSAQIASIIMVEALTRTTLGNLANVDLGVFKQGASETLKQSLGLVGDGANELEKTAKGVLSLFK